MNSVWINKKEVEKKLFLLNKFEKEKLEENKSLFEEEKLNLKEDLEYFLNLNNDEEKFNYIIKSNHYWSFLSYISKDFITVNNIIKLINKFLTKEDNIEIKRIYLLSNILNWLLYPYDPKITFTFKFSHDTIKVFNDIYFEYLIEFLFNQEITTGSPFLPIKTSSEIVSIIFDENKWKENVNDLFELITLIIQIREDAPQAFKSLGFTKIVFRKANEFDHGFFKVKIPDTLCSKNKNNYFIYYYNLDHLIRDENGRLTEEIELANIPIFPEGSFHWKLQRVYNNL